MKVTFAHPPGLVYNNWDVSDIDSFSPPLGILLLAAQIRKHGHQPTLIDARARKLSVEKTAEEVIRLKPEILALTAMTISISQAAEIAGLVKQSIPNIITIVGGSHITAVPVETMEIFPQFDIGVIGEGEITILELLNNLEKRLPLENVTGLAIRQEGKIYLTQKKDFILNLDSLPFPAWDLLSSLDDYRCSISNSRRTPSTAFITSRGCPGQCTFCDTSVFGRKVRGYSVDYIINVLKHLKENYAIRDIVFYDDTMFARRKVMLDLCNTMINEKLDLTWSCESRVDLVTRELLMLMKKAGCWIIEYGIESGSQKLLNLMNKKINKDQIRRAISWTKEAGILSRGNFMFGNFGETKDTLEETIKFACELDLDYMFQTFLIPYPGSVAYQTAERYGKFNKDWKTMDMLSANTFVPFGLTQEDLLYYSNKFFKEFYFRPKIIFSHIKSIKSAEDIYRNYKAAKAFLKTFHRQSSRA